ncbi:GNAT family N-acetyltransferase [Methylocella silvestris]|uniref:GNAT family N-acetyltransferase n=1 Tax=Methylocella silvestris TaxID=199596 RepID=A0A2J7TKI1_METSI|nr:GNAT family N-acetyltransferase [Methylocella silvestris]PNG27282.1 GNAT family N-acetyltransferase [Methylocella silvestris]
MSVRPTASAPSLRPYLAADLPLLYEIRLSAIEELTADDYDDSQRRAWAEAASDEDVLEKILKGGLSIVALRDGAAVGFAVLTGNRIDQLYVHPAVARTGVADALLDAIEKLAAARKLTALEVDASDTAKPLFDKRGYVAQRRNTVAYEDAWLGNTRMKKALPAGPPQ